MAYDVVSSFHLRSDLAPERKKKKKASERKGGRRQEREEAGGQVGECVLTKPFERSRYELAVNLCIL